jgi:hypothetical protein
MKILSQSLFCHKCRFANFFSFGENVGCVYFVLFEIKFISSTDKPVVRKIISTGIFSANKFFAV